MSDASKRPAEGEIDFEAALAALETIVHELEEGDIGLAQGLAHYERGVGLLKRCYQLLERAERQIELLTGIDAEGQPITAALDDTEQTLVEKSQQRAKRRSAPAGGTRRQNAMDDDLGA